MDNEKLLRVLILDESLNDADTLASHLRNAGYALRPSGAETDAQLREALTGQPVDLILCAVESTEPSLLHVHAALKSLDRDIPVIAVTDEHDAEILAEVMRDGARDLVVKDNPEHLQLVVERELAAREARRRLRQADRAVRESEKRCRALLDSSRDAITYVHDGMHIYANPVYLELFGFHELEDIEGMPIMDMVAPEHHARFKEFIRSFAQGKAEQNELEVLGLRGDGNTFKASMELSPATIEGEPCTQIIIRNQSMDKELEKKIKYLSKQDLLTGLYNRQYFIEELEQAIADAAGGTSASAVLYVEPDGFKDIKAKVGMSGADLVLSDLAGLIRGQLGESCIAARFGDQVFTILCRETDSNIAEVMAAQLRGAIESHISDVEGQSITLTASIGIALVGEAVADAQEVLSRADLACEMARKKGGSGVHLHNPLADEKAGRERDQEWIEKIRDALEQGRFQLVYQPIASLHGETQEKYEVLLRMRDEDGAVVLPAQFLPIAESHNLINAVDRWVIGHAIAVLSERRRGGHDTTFFIKVAAKSTLDESLLPWISEQLKKARLQGDNLVFEVSESSAVTHLKQVKAFAAGVKELRCGFSLEHFGNGMNSFQLLKHIPADYLKIDGSFMHNLASNQESQAMVKSITEMAHSMGRTTIAEFVEDANSLAVLWQSGVNYIQGHFLQEPGEEMNYDFRGEEA